MIEGGRKKREEETPYRGIAFPCWDSRTERRRVDVVAYQIKGKRTQDLEILRVKRTE